MIYDGSRYQNTPAIVINDEFSFTVRELTTKDGLAGFYSTIPGDTSLDIVAYQLYGRSDWWWIIADCNDIKNLFDITEDIPLFIPIKESAESVYYGKT